MEEFVAKGGRSVVAAGSTRYLQTWPFGAEKSFYRMSSRLVPAIEWPSLEDFGDRERDLRSSNRAQKKARNRSVGLSLPEWSLPERRQRQIWKKAWNVVVLEYRSYFAGLESDGRHRCHPQVCRLPSCIDPDLRQ